MIRRVRRARFCSSWLGGSFNFTPPVGPVVFHHFDTAGRYPYQMSITASGCSKVYYDTVDVKINSSVYDESAYQLNVFPNPAKHSTEISIGNNNCLICSVVLYDQYGRQVFTMKNINAKAYNLQRKHIKDGIYLLEIRFSDNGVFRKKLIFE